MRLKPATLLKVTLFRGCFSRFLNCTNHTKSRNNVRMRSGYCDTNIVTIVRYPIEHLLESRCLKIRQMFSVKKLF